MDKEIWISVKKYYAELPGMPEEEQEALIRRLEREEPEVAGILNSLLKEEGGTDPALETPAISKIREPEDPTNLIGQTIGKYKLTYLIGIGGMGRVYLADRMDLEAHQQVAVKIISAGFLTDIYTKRFDRERKILSRLNHPHITRIYDGGISEGGRPYIIMEYVQGKPLMEYVADNNLNLDQRLELFLDICDAVNYAHQNFIMHRDLKPGNILVTHHGIVKVIDFGIAKILEDDASDEDLTMMGYIPLTPAYASPEQLKGQPLTVASDIYSLGVILYELVTGKKPFPGSTKSNLALTERIRYTDDAIKPSANIDPSITHELKAWQKNLKGDIDNIVLKALKENPSERYTSAEQLSDDLKRYQNNYPVLARADSLGYRFKKYAQRNRSLVALGTLLILILVTGVTAILWQAGKVAEQRDQARFEAEKAQKITSFLTQLFDYSDPDRSKGDVITSETMLDRGSEMLGELDGQPELQAEIYRIVGDLYRKQNLFAEAEAHLVQALRLFEEHLGEEHLEVAKTKLLLAELYAFQNRTAETIEMSSEAAEIFADEEGKGSADFVKAKSYVARGEMQSGDYRKALAGLLEIAILTKDWENPTEAQSVALVSLYNDIASAYNGIGDHDNYVIYLRKALSEIFRTKGEVNQNVAALYNNLGHSFYFLDQYDSAAFYTLKALKIADELYRGKPNDRSQFAHCDLAKIYIETGRLNEALKHAELCHSMAEAVYGEVHAATARGLGVIGDVYIARGDFRSAEEYRSVATTMYETFFGEEDPMLAWHYWDEAERYFQTGNIEKAIEYKRKCIDMYQRTMPGEVNDLAEARFILAGFLMEADSIQTAIPFFEESLEAHEELYGGNDDQTKKVAQNLLEAYEFGGFPEKATALRSRLSGSEPD